MADSPKKPPISPWKGKEKAAPQDDFSDLNPVITYRHLHSHNLGVKDPLRVIALCDSDAFYASCEQVRLNLDPSIPLVVLQWDALIAVNYPARTFGISRMDKLKDALKRCPHLVVQHVATYKEGEAEPGYWENPDTLTHKVSLDFYRRESWKIYHMFKEGLPTAEIEKASIDEAFIDFTRPVRDEILKRYPYLAEVPPDAPFGKDSPLPPPPPILWDNLGTLIPVNPVPPTQAGTTDTRPEDTSEDKEPAPQPVSDPPSKADPEKTEDEGSPTWHDVALSIAAELMAKVRLDIHTKLGYTMTAGIARNKFLAKLTASYKKPNNQSILRNAAIPNYLKPVPFQKIRFLGGKLGVALAQEYDVNTVGDLLTVSLEEMQRRFGEESIWVWEILRGIDRTEVKEKPPITKSMLASKNLPRAITKTSEGHHWIRVLAAELALRLREARESVPALWPKTLVLHVRQGYEAFKSKQAPFPFVREITVDLIAHAGDKLWKELVGPAKTMNITNVSLAFTGIDSLESGQKRIEGFFGTSDAPTSGGSNDEVPKIPKESAMGTIATSSSRLKRKRSSSTPKADSRSPSDDNHGEGTSVVVPDAGSSATADASSFVCDRCKKRIALPSSIDAADDNDEELALEQGGDTRIDIETIREVRLAQLRAEHADYHFAEDLASNGGASPDARRVTLRPSGGSGSSNGNENGNGGTVKKKKQKKPSSRGAKTKEKEKPKGKGIEKFFVQGKR